MGMLWLVSWFPNRYDPFDGDFIERHARAAALKDRTHVIFVKKAPSTKGNKAEEVFTQHSPSLSTSIFYYPSFTKWGRLMEVLHSGFFYLFLHFKAFKKYNQQFGRPAGILVQVGLNAGVIALLWKFLYRIPYVLFERWGGFLDEANPTFAHLSCAKKLLWKQVYRHSRRLVAVTHYFGNAIVKKFSQKPLSVVPNAVDSTLFFPAHEKGPVFRFSHVSTLDENKNFRDVLLATKRLIATGKKMEMVVFGPHVESLYELRSALGLAAVVNFMGEVPHADLAAEMRQCHCLILYSRQETFGNVLIEANACGLPVIVSDLPVFKEIVTEGVNGIYARRNDPEALAEKMLWMMKNHDRFDALRIHGSAIKKYSPSVIAELFHRVFQEAFAPVNDKGA